MEKIGETVRRELGRFGTAGAMTDLVAAWPGVVGEQVAANAWPARFARDGTLLVSTSSSAWAFELGHLESEILPRLQEALAESGADPSQVRSGAVARALAGCLRGPENAPRRAHPGAGARGPLVGRRDRLGRTSQNSGKSCASQPREGRFRPLGLIEYE